MLRYTGSLSAPPCTENARWIIFKTPIGIRLKQLDYFRKLRTTPKTATDKNQLEYEIPQIIGDNYREIQRKDDVYTVYENYMIQDEHMASPRKVVGSAKSLKLVGNSDNQATTQHSISGLSYITFTTAIVFLVKLNTPYIV